MILKIASILCLSYLSFSPISTNKITIKIIDPIEKWVYKPLDTIWIKADIRSNEQLHNINLLVMNLEESVVLYNKNIHTHANTVQVKEFFINPLLEKKGLRLSIKTNDHDGNILASEWVNFSTSAKKKKKK